MAKQMYKGVIYWQDILLVIGYNQFGYEIKTSYHSCTFFLIFMLWKAIDKGTCSLTYAKHLIINVLCLKLENYWIQGVTYEWFIVT